MCIMSILKHHYIQVISCIAKKMYKVPVCAQHLHILFDKGRYLNVLEYGMVSTENNIFMCSEGDDGFIGTHFFYLKKITHGA